MIFLVSILLIFTGNMASTKTLGDGLDSKYVARSEWNARAPKEHNPLTAPVPYVVIHHSFDPPACYSLEKCKLAMKQMQDFHMDVREWADIGYNWAVGSDGVVYEGRGWELMGAHSLHFNNVSIGIVLIGDWTSAVPPLRQLHKTNQLIQDGVKHNFIQPNYKLVGHRQVRDTECPGDALFNAIQSFGHYKAFPRTYKDLPEVFNRLDNSAEDNLIPD